MLVWARRLVLIILCTVLVGMSTFSNAVTASPPMCSASISPTYVDPSSTNTFELEINNDGSTSIDYIFITTPSSNMSILDMVAEGWGAQGGGLSMSLQYASIAPGDSLVITILAETGGDEMSAANWSVEVSDDGGGTLSSCNGALDLTISNTPPSSIPPEISDIYLANLTATSVTIHWTTDEGSTSQVSYGKTLSYETSTTVSPALTTTHSVVLSDLISNTGYHFQVVSTDASNNTAYSSDNTFLTPVAASAETSPTLNSRDTIKKKPTESIPPGVNFAVTLEKAYKTAPTLKGTASDNDAVAVVEYTTDGGQNWQPATKLVGIGTPKVSFEITPSELNDGNYKFRIRAVDASGNEFTTPEQMLVVDKLPPVIGGVMVSQGNQPALPNGDGEQEAQVGVDQLVSLSAVGGATEITLVATETMTKKQRHTFQMTQSSQTGLWKGLLSFSEPGKYNITARAVDGAGNTTNRELSTVKVISPGSVKNSKGELLPVNLKIFSRNEETKTWELWDAESYSQQNPKIVNAKEGVSFYLPEGLYYIKISSPGYQSIVTSRFEIVTPSFVNSSYIMKRSFGVTLFGRNIRLPWLNYQKNSNQTASGNYAHLKGITDHSLSQFALPLTNGKTLKTTDLYGKPTVVTFISTWNTHTASQLAVFDELDTRTINVLPVGTGESMARLKSYIALGGYKTPILVDTSNKLADELGLGTLPVTYFIDRHGVVKKIIVGVLSHDEITKNLTL